MGNRRYQAIVEQLAEQIRSGERPPGSRLPTHRQLATDQGVALVTASRAYAELEKIGLVSSETGRGTFVRDRSLPLTHGIDQHANIAGSIDLNFNSPALPEQTELLRDGLRRLISGGDLEALLHYQPHAGRDHERAIVASHLRQRGLSPSADQVLLVSGAQHALALSAMTLLQPGELIACDSLIYPGFKAVCEACHLQITALNPAQQGPDLDQLEQLCQQRNLKAIYTMPTLHNPLGWVMPLEQREHLVQLARTYDLLIIEDAAYAYLEDDAPAPLAALAPERTLYCSGLSKSVATGLRLGFLVAPPHQVGQLERSIRATTWNTPGLLTALGCQWIEDGTVARLEHEKRKDAQTRQALAREILRGLNYRSHPNAYFIWLTLPEEVRADQVAAELQQTGISVSTAEPYAVSPHVPHALRLALGSVDLATLRVALETVRRVIEQQAYGL
ncbi:PLP-dependent aminotransferase family protein [Neptuniibacter halophilus]|uniref:aminotransferase-like domain-containing protein n=1 Tax=Neptuniibacter halophilus TaxID=651666 RepID=UPI002572DD38|nr:PLP-dependent aminotransferase family protein [Neptuniibacter halophilus]